VVSFGANITDETGAVWPIKIARGPRWLTDFAGLESFRRFAEAVVEFGRRFAGAEGASEGFELQNPTVVSLEAESMRDEGPCTARDSMPSL
jgi:hypothetical protein